MPTHDVHARPIALSGAAILVCVVAVVITVFALLRHWQLSPGADRVRKIDVPAGAPLLQSAPQPDLARYREDKRKQLESSGWVDATTGIAHIPIDAAVDVLAPHSPASAQVRP